MKAWKQWAVSIATMIALGAGGVLSSTAQADGLVCNTYQTDIWFAYTVSDSSCGGDPFKQRSWWLVPRNQCITIFSQSAANRSYFTYAEAVDGSRQWPNSDSLVWQEKFNDSFGQEPGLCFDLAQVSCTNPGVTCLNKPHTQTDAGAATRVTFEFTNF